MNSAYGIDTALSLVKIPLSYCYSTDIWISCVSSAYLAVMKNDTSWLGNTIIYVLV